MNVDKSNLSSEFFLKFNQAASNDGKISASEFQELSQLAQTGEDIEVLTLISNDQTSVSFAIDDGTSSSVYNLDIDFGEEVCKKEDLNINLSDVPDSLKTAFQQAVSDGILNRKEYENLIKVAAPNDSDTELSDEEFNFLNSIREVLSQNNDSPIYINLNKDSDESTQPVVISSRDIPDSLKDQFNNVIKDGVITIDEFQTLLTTAAPNKENQEFSEDEIYFLSQIRNAIEKNGRNPIEIELKD